MRRLRFLSSLMCWALVTSIPADERAVDHVARVKAGTELFRTSVRRILTDKCLSCHGGESLEGELNLASREGLLKGGEKGAAIVPGQAAESRLFRMINHTEKPHMPYDEDKLPMAEITAIGQWIDMEAPYDQPLVEGVVELTDWTERAIASDDRRFWSFQPLRNVSPPQVADAGWCKNDVDRFVQAAQEQHQLKPNAIADRRTLIRRTYFGLIGLPPEPDELQRLLKDPTVDWHDRMVDDLLDSHHFGERWARHWLDIARFAESHGFEQDYNRDFAYHYRDFVIRAFNRDMPYDQFVQWQLAGDEMAPQDPMALMATGFLGAGVFPTQLTEKEFEPARYDELDDMVSTLGTAMLGMTIGCARCHDHKFDPIPAADYYRLISTFGATIRSNVEVDLSPDRTRHALEKWQSEREPLAAALRDFEKTRLGQRFDTWLTSEAGKTLQQAPQAEWWVLHVIDARSTGGARLTVQPDESILATGPNPDFDTYTFTAETQLTELRSLRLEALSHESLQRGGPGRADNGNMGLGTLAVTAEPLSGDEKPVTVKLINPRATFQQNDSNLAIAAAIDNASKTGWAVDPQFGQDHAAAFDFEQPVGFAGGTRLTVTLTFDVNNRHNIGRARLSVSNATTAPTLDATSQPQALAELMSLVSSGATPVGDLQRQQFLQAYRILDPEWNRLSAALATHDQAKPTPTLTTVMVSSEGVKPIPHHADGRGFPHFYPQTFFLKRGDTNQKVRPAEPGFLQVLTTDDTADRTWDVSPPQDATTSYHRSKLANWMTDTNGGAGQLLARVIVNRLWQHHMGRGIVSTPNDFGKQGEQPTHPELLDWLAGQLIASGWRLKPIHRLILQSATYQQNTDFDEQRFRIDPENRWLWRREPRRLEAEVIRDSMLAVGNQLDRTQFGPGTLDESHKRRSIYFMIKRSSLIPMMQIFDSPEPLASVGDRPSTTIASQALMFMNSPHVRGYADGFARRVMDSADVVQQVYLRGLARSPTDLERTSADMFLKTQAESYVADGRTNEDADRLALTDLCQTVFSLNEFVFVD